MYYLEWCLDVTRRNGTFLPIDVVNSRVGFRSVYAFLEKLTSSKGLGDKEVYSDTLFLDFDDGLTGAYIKAIQFFRDSNITFQSYASGNKGAHIHVAIQPMVGGFVPDSQAEYIKHNGINCDLSIYRHSSLIRLPGTIHTKTNKIKEQIDCHSGNLLHIPLLETLTTKPRFTNLVVSPQGELINAIGRLDRLLSIQPAAGNRTITIWSLASTFARAGISFDTCLELCYELNNSWKEPKEDEVVLKKVREAYGK